MGFPMLHIVKSQQAITEMLRTVAPDDSVLLIEDAVYLANPSHHLHFLVANQKGLTVLAPDVRARGLSELISHQIVQVEYTGFVELTERYQRSLTWD